MSADSPHIRDSSGLVRASLPILTLLLAAIASLLMVVDTLHGQRIAIGALWIVAALPAFVLRRTEGHVVTSPAVMYPLVYALFCTSPVILQAIGGPDIFGILKGSGYSDFLRVALVGLVGFQLGGYVFSTRKSASSRLPLIGFTRAQRSILAAGCLAATLLLLVNNLMTGEFAQLLVGGYGKQQMQYGLQYYMYLGALFLFGAAFGQLMADDLLVHHHLTRPTLFLGIPYLALTVLTGGRAQLLTTSVAGLVMWDLRAGPGHRRRSTSIVLIVVSLILASGILVSIRGSSAMGSRASLKQQYGRSGTVAVTGALTDLLEDFQGPIFTAVWTIRSVPQDIDYVRGRTLLSLLVPSFISSHWDLGAKSASVVFHDAYMPLVTDSGYGYTIMADGYLNFGYVGAFALMAIIGYMLARLERQASSSASPFVLGVYGIVFYQSLWALRADLTALVKGILIPIVAAWLLVFVFPGIVRRSGRADSHVADNKLLQEGYVRE